MKIKKFFSWFLILIFIFNTGYTDIYADNNHISLSEADSEAGYYVIQLENGEAKDIKTIYMDTVKEFTKTTSKISVWGKKFYVDSESSKIYLQEKPKKNHTITIEFNNGDKCAFTYRVHDNQKGKYEYTDVNNMPKKQIHVKLEGYFDGVIVGQRKIDAMSGATGSVKENKNSHVKVLVAQTNEGEKPKNSDFKPLAKSDIEVDKGKTHFNFDTEKSGLAILYNFMTSDVSMRGDKAGEAGKYTVSLDLYDIYGRHAKSNEIHFVISDPENVYLEDALTSVNANIKQSKNGKTLWMQDPWRIFKFSKKESNGIERVVVDKNINLWYGSNESGLYGELGKIIPVEHSQEAKEKNKGSVLPWEDRIPTQELVLNEGTNMTLAYMKVFSGVNIIVNEGAILNVHDSSIYGKITVNKGGVLRVNYDPDGKNIATTKVDSSGKLISGTSIQGQIILNDGAVLENSYIYSHTTFLSDTKALQNIRPVVLVRGDAFIKGNVFVRGDEAPPGQDQTTNKSYRGQTALKIENGSLTIPEDASLYLYGGGVDRTTFLGGNGLELDNGKVLGDGTLFSIGGNGTSDVAGHAVSGNGDISVENAYLKAGNTFEKKLGEQKAIETGVRVHSNVIGKIIDTKPTNYMVDDDYWKAAALPKKITKEKIGDKKANENGEAKIPGKEVPKDIEEKKFNTKKRVQLSSGTYNFASISAEMKNDDTKEWLEKLANGEGTVTLYDNEKSYEEKKIKTTLHKVDTDAVQGYKVEHNQLYIYKLDVGNMVKVEVEGYFPIVLNVAELDDSYTKFAPEGKRYRLEQYSKADDSEYENGNNKEEYDLNEENVKKAQEKLRVVTNQAQNNFSILDLDGIKKSSTIDHSPKIEELKRTINEINALCNKEFEQLNEQEKTRLVQFSQMKDGRYVEFEKITKNIRLDLKNSGSRDVSNKHDGSRKHVKMKDGQISLNTSVKDDLSIEVFYVTKEQYDENKKMDTMTGATPRFEENSFDPKYYSVNSQKSNTETEYAVTVKEKEFVEDYINTNKHSVNGPVLLKILFRKKLADGIYIENKDFVFLESYNMDHDQLKNFLSMSVIPEEKVESIKLDDNTEIVFEDSPLEYKIIKTNGKGHYEYSSGESYTVINTEKVETKNTPPTFISGYADSTFRPLNKITRAEAATMVFHLQQENKKDTKPLHFVDCKDSWYNGALNYAVKNDMLLIENNRLRPDEIITRGEFAKLLRPILKEKGEKSHFIDIKNHRFEDDINLAYANGVVSGFPDQTFKPNFGITRAEAVSILNRTYGRTVTQKEIDNNIQKITFFKDVSKSHWAYMDIVSAANYSKLNEKTETSYQKTPVTYRGTSTSKWVWDEKPKEIKILVNKMDDNDDKNIEYQENLILTSSDASVTITGKIEKNSQITKKELCEISQNGKITYRMPKKMYHNLAGLIKKDEKNIHPLYKIIKLYDVNIDGHYKENIDITFDIGKEYDGKKAIVKQIINNETIETFDNVVVKDGKLNVTANRLSLFAILIENDLQDKEKEKQEIETLKKTLKECRDSAEQEMNKPYSEDIKRQLKSSIESADEMLRVENKKEELTKEITKIKELLQSLPKIPMPGEDEKEKEKEKVQQAKSKLQQAIVTAKEKLKESSKYESAGIEKLTRLLQEAQGKMKDSNLLSEIEQAKENLEKAINELVEKTTVPPTPSPTGGKKVKFEDMQSGKYIKVDASDKDSKEWIQKIKRKENISIKNITTGEQIKDGMFGKVYSFTEQGNRVDLHITGLSADDEVEIKVEGYEDIRLKAEKDGSFYKLKRIASSSVNPPMPPTPSPTGGKKVKFEDMQSGKYIKVDASDEDSKEWIQKIKRKENISIKNITTGEQIKDGMFGKVYSFTEQGNRVDLYITGLSADDEVEIKVEGYEDIRLKAEGGSFYKLKRVIDSIMND